MRLKHVIYSNTNKYIYLEQKIKVCCYIKKKKICISHSSSPRSSSPLLHRLPVSLEGYNNFASRTPNGRHFMHI